MHWLSWWDRSLDRASSAVNSSHQQSRGGTSRPLLTQLLYKWAAQWRTVPAVHGSSSPATHKELYCTWSLHHLPELAISVHSLYLNHGEMRPSSCPLPSTARLLFHLWSMPGPQTSNLPFRHEVASGLWCRLAGYMSTDWIQALKETILGSHWYCLSESVVFPGVLSPGRRRTSEAGPTLQRPAHVYQAQPSLWIVRR